MDILRDALGIPVLAHKRSDEYLLDARMNLSALCGPPITVDNVVYLDDGDEVKLQTDSGTSLKVIYTPGHTTDSVIFFSEKDSVAFVGDTIFRGSIGNYQYPGGNAVDLQRSIINKIFSLPDDTILCSGHSEQTTVGREKKAISVLKRHVVMKDAQKKQPETTPKTGDDRNPLVWLLFGINGCMAGAAWYLRKKDENDQNQD